MLRAIFYKEWLKLRLFWGLAVGRDILMINQLTYLPLITGVCLALCQWLPEMQAKRIRLTLHLPIDNHLSIGAMLGCSIIGLCVLFGLDAALLAGVGQIWLPRELVWRTFLTCLPWYLGGLIGYNIVSWWVLEPQWKIRCVDMLIGAPLVALCFLTTQPACYIQMIPWLIGLLLCTACLPLYSIYRFKLGKQ